MRIVLPVLLLVATSYAQRSAPTRLGGRGTAAGQPRPSPQRINHPEILTRWRSKPKPRLQDPADPVDPPEHPAVKQQALPAFTPLGEQGRYIPVYDPVPASPPKYRDRSRAAVPVPAPAPITAQAPVVYSAPAPRLTIGQVRVYDSVPAPVPVPAPQTGPRRVHTLPTRIKSGPPPSGRKPSTNPPTQTKVGPPPLRQQAAYARTQSVQNQVAQSISYSKSRTDPSVSGSFRPTTQPRQVGPPPVNKPLPAGQTAFNNKPPVAQYKSEGNPEPIPPTQTKVGPPPVKKPLPANPPASNKPPVAQYQPGAEPVAIPPTQTKVGPPPIKKPLPANPPASNKPPIAQFQPGAEPVSIQPTQTKVGPPPVKKILSTEPTLSNKRPPLAKYPPGSKPESPLQPQTGGNPKRTMFGPSPQRQQALTVVPAVPPATNPTATGTSLDNKPRAMPPTRTKSGPPPYRQPPRVGRRIPEYRDTHLFNGARPRETPIVRGPPPPSFSQNLPQSPHRRARPIPIPRPPTRTKSLGNLVGPEPVYAPTEPPMPTVPPTIPPPSPTVFMTYDRPEVKKEEEEES